MSYLSIKKVEPTYISFYDKQRIIYINYDHPLYATHGVTIHLSDISISTNDGLIQVHILSDQNRGTIRKIESNIQDSFPRLYKILHNESLYIPLNPTTSQFVNGSISQGYITLKHLKETRDQHYKAIIHFHLK